MKHLGFFAFLLAVTFGINSCGDDDPVAPTEPCATVKCVYGDCVLGDCDCLEGYTGTLCDEEKTPSKIVVTKMVIKAFPGMNGTKTWDELEDDDGTGPDITLQVTDLVKTYFKARDLTTQLHPDADPGKTYDIPCSFSILPADDSEDYTTELNFTLVDQDFVDNIEDMFFMGSIKADFKDSWPSFPSVIELSSATGKLKLDLHVSYEF